MLPAWAVSTIRAASRAKGLMWKRAGRGAGEESVQVCADGGLEPGITDVDAEAGHALGRRVPAEGTERRRGAG